MLKGFSNWKKALGKINLHEKSYFQQLASHNLEYPKNEAPVKAKSDTAARNEQLKARNALVKVISSLKYLAEQGLAIRGKESSGGNFQKLLELRMKDVNDLMVWLGKTTSYTCVMIQNEMLEIMSLQILGDICNDINNISVKFAVIVDRIQDIQGLEQETICIRHTDPNFEVHEYFVGLYNVEEATGMAVSSMIQDVVLRL